MTKIMILEDSIDSLKALKVIVESVSKDIAVIPVKSLEEARAALQDEANLFQAFLLDINLDEQKPQDASGMEFAREVRNDSRYVFTPVIMITSLANLELAAYRELHCYQYILKPYQREEIEKLIQKVLFQTGLHLREHPLSPPVVSLDPSCDDRKYLRNPDPYAADSDPGLQEDTFCFPSFHKVHPTYHSQPSC